MQPYEKWIEEYASFLKDKYIKMATLPSSDGVLCCKRKYTAVSLVERNKRHLLEQQAKKWGRTFSHGEVEKLITTSKEIHISEIFSLDAHSEKPVKILMDGAAGIGKSTISRKICQVWANGELRQQYDLVVLVELSKIKSDEVKSLENFISADDDSLSEKVVKYIKRNSGKNILMIFDGYDQLTVKERTQKSFVLDIIRGDKFHNISLLITSRPHASGYLQSQKCIDHCIEVVGFTKEQARQYFETSAQDEGKAEALVQHLQGRYSNFHIPLHCSIMLHIFEQSEEPLQTEIHADLYETFILHLLKRHAMSSGYAPEIVNNITNLKIDKLPYPLNIQFDMLCEMAYYGEKERKYKFSNDNVKDAQSSEYCDSQSNPLSNSLMTAVKYSTTKSEELDYRFLHDNVQDFLAATWANEHLSDYQKAELFQPDHLKNDMHRLMLLVLARKSQLTTPIMDKLNQAASSIQLEPIQPRHMKPRRSLSNIDGKHRKHSHTNTEIPQVKDGGSILGSTVEYYGSDAIHIFLLSVHLIYESRKFILFQKLLDSLNEKERNKLFFSRCRLTTTDCTALAHFLSGTKHEWKLIAFDICSLTGHSLEIFHKISVEQHTTSQFEEIYFSYNAASFTTKLCLLPKIRWFTKTKKVTIDGLQYDEGVPTQLEEAVNAVLEMVCLTELSISVQQIPKNEEDLINYTAVFLRLVHALKKKKHLKFSYEHPHTSNCQMFQCTATALKDKTLHLSSVFKIQRGYECELSLVKPSWKMCTTLTSKLFSLPCMNHIETAIDFSRNETLFQNCTECSTPKELAIIALKRLLKKNATILCIKLSPRGLNNEDIKALLDADAAQRLHIELEKHELEITSKIELSLVPHFHDTKTVTAINDQRETLIQFTQEMCTVLDMKSITELVVSIPHIPDCLLPSYLSLFSEFADILTSKAVTSLQKFSYQHPGNSNCSIFVYTAETLKKNTSLHLTNTLKIQKGYPKCELTLLRPVWKLCSTVVFYLFKLPCMEHVKTVDFSGTDPTAPLSRCTDRENCSVSRKMALESLRDLLRINNSISSINLSHCGLESQDTTYIGVGLANNTKAEALNISKNKINCRGIMRILELLKSNTTLTHIDMCNQLDTKENVMCGIDTLHYIVAEKAILYGQLELQLSIPGVNCVNVCQTGNVITVSLCHYVTDKGCEHLFDVLNQNQRTHAKVRLVARGNTLCRRVAMNMFNQLTWNIRCLEEVDFSLNENLVGRHEEAIGSALQRMLTQNSTLQVLKLHRCGITDGIGKMIGNGILMNNSLRVLDISDCKVGSNGALSILQSLRHNTSLKDINFSGNRKLTERNSVAVANMFYEMLTQNTTLHVLRLHRCGICDVIGSRIGEALNVNRTLKCLDVSYCRIKFGGALSILKSLEHNTTLIKLDLSQNSHLANDDARTLHNMLKRLLAKNVTLLEFRYNEYESTVV